MPPPQSQSQTQTQPALPKLSPIVHTAQLDDPLRPLVHLPPDALVDLRAAVASVPDPAETRFGRSFDIVLAAMLNAFQASGYVLDGFALQWPVPAEGGGREEKRSAGDGGGKDGRKFGDATVQHRVQPGLLMFRRDHWRNPAASAGSAVEYYLVFLVGESSTYGVQPEAFQRAARCAVRFNRGQVLVSTLAPNEDCDVPAWRQAGPLQLDVFGPAFSGSAQSLAVALAQLCGADECLPSNRPLQTLLLSPSATVASNANIASHPFVSAKAGATGAPATSADLPAAAPYRVAVEYFPLAVSLSEQLDNLITYLCQLPRAGSLKVAILAEESTFGRDMLQKVTRKTGRPRCRHDQRHIIFVTAQFPPNIASIRAEHSSLAKPQLQQQRNLQPSNNRLLEFNLDEVDAGRDRPPAYRAQLSSRSDELMLYRMFDSMRLYSRPDVVVVVATDIRDRLFLLSRVRDEMPAALPVLMELDYLTIHPDYRRTSRGAVVVPSADSVVCLDDNDRLVECYGKRRARYFTFPSDYSANVFRAVSLLLEYRHAKPTSGAFAAFAQPRVNTLNAPTPTLYVATLAGFQSLWGEPRSSMAAAELRVLAQVPTYLALVLLAAFFVLVGGWLWSDPNEGRTMLPFARHLLFDSRWLLRRLEAIPERVGWAAARLRGAAPPRVRASRIARTPESGVESMTPEHNRACLLLLIALAAGTALVASWRLYQLVMAASCQGTGCRDFQLAHGRDLAALACIWLLYACVALVGHLRVNIIDRRYTVYLNALAPAATRGRRYSWAIQRASWVVPGLAGALTVGVYWRISARPVSVDLAYPWLFAIGVLAIGIGFLIHLGRQLRMLDRLTLFLSACIPQVQALRQDGAWPKPHSIHEVPQTPFNLSLHRYRDLRMLRRRRPEQWGYLTRGLLDGGDTAAPLRSPLVFCEWQAQLVAEMKLVAVAIRTCAWCAMLAPIAVLLATAVFPPVYGEVVISASIALLVIGFAMTVYVVLRLETDPMLGVMFTRDGDNLTFGGSLRALWPKFVAMGLVLLPLVAPEVWGLLHGLIRSINSIQ